VIVRFQLLLKRFHFVHEPRAFAIDIGQPPPNARDFHRNIVLVRQSRSSFPKI